MGFGNEAGDGKGSDSGNDQNAAEAGKSRRWIQVCKFYLLKERSEHCTKKDLGLSV